MFRRMTSVLVVLFAAAMLGACMSPVKSEVTSFHDNALPPPGASVRVVALDRRKSSTLEFEHYAGLVSEQLRQAGYVPVGSNAQADLLAEVDYTISDGETVLRTRPGIRRHPSMYGYYDPFWGWYSPWYSPWHDPYWGLGGYGDYPETYSYQQYHRDLRLRIIGAHSDRNAKPLYEGRAHSVGREQELAEVLPQMVSALFEDFPGQSGVTREVSVSRNDG